ncbi:MAG: hypothetical protein HY796_04955, partial [Elusimicrobia bacterium]|nr:hypothetical protein [Elusimicrobiota bacterium]
MANIILLNPEIILASAGLCILLAGAFINENRARLLFHFGTISAAAVLGMVLSQAAFFAYGTGTMWILDPGAQLFKFIILAATVFTLLLSVNYSAIQPRHIGTYTALLLWASCGMMLLSGAMDFIYLLISLELISISCFILTGFEQK